MPSATRRRIVSRQQDEYAAASARLTRRFGVRGSADFVVALFSGFMAVSFTGRLVSRRACGTAWPRRDRAESRLGLGSGRAWSLQFEAKSRGLRRNGRRDAGAVRGIGRRPERPMTTRA